MADTKKGCHTATLDKYEHQSMIFLIHFKQLLWESGLDYVIETRTTGIQRPYLQFSTVQLWQINILKCNDNIIWKMQQ